jgi:hypothetical protein
MIIRGTTPTITAEMPIDATAIKDCRLVFSQKDGASIIKKLSDCSLIKSELTATLSQEETLQFTEDKAVQIQLKVLTTEGQVLASDIINEPCCKCLCEEVLK